MSLSDCSTIEADLVDFRSCWLPRSHFVRPSGTKCSKALNLHLFRSARTSSCGSVCSTIEADLVDFQSFFEGFPNGKRYAVSSIQSMQKMLNKDYEKQKMYFVTNKHFLYMDLHMYFRANKPLLKLLCCTFYVVLLKSSTFVLEIISL